MEIIKNMKSIQQSVISQLLTTKITRYLSVLVCIICISVTSNGQNVIKAHPDDSIATDIDRKFIKRAYEIARNAVEHGNHPFGALLVHQGKVVSEFENDVVTSGDITKHAETGLIGFASKTLSRNILSESVLYTSTEPCIMCCGAIYWAGIQKIVFGVSQSQMEIQISATSSNYRISSEEVFRKIDPKMIIIGPVLEKEGLEIHAKFWPEFIKRKRE